MRKFMLLGLCFTTLASAAPRDPAYPEQVYVGFDNLHWVGSRTLMPSLQEGRVIVPPVETCDLLGLACTMNADLLTANGQSFPIIRLYAEKVAMVALAPLVRLAGQTIVWNEAAKYATVSGGQGSAGWLAYRNLVPGGKLPFSTEYHGPLRASQTAPKTGQATVQQILFAEAELKALTLFSKTNHALTIVGSLTPSTPDNPNQGPACHADNPKVCELPVPRDALWVLAFVTAK